MAKITINEISKNYAYYSGNSTFCSVALPITASWGPAFEEPSAVGESLDTMLETTAFQHFPCSQEGLETFISTYRGPASNYRSAKDYSYQIAMTLLSMGYDLDVCRVCSGTHASGTFNATIGTEGETGSFTVRAKYPGSFGNNLIATFGQVDYRNYWSLVVYIQDSTGGKTAVENLVFVFDIENSTDTIPHISEISSNFFDFVVDGIETDEEVTFDEDIITCSGGSDKLADESADEMMAHAIELATTRYGLVGSTDVTEYANALNQVRSSNPSVAKASVIRYREWNYNAAYYVLEILTDKLAYNCKRIILPGWDDQDIQFLTGEYVNYLASLSPLHVRMMNVAAQTRCATALIDIPRSLLRSGVWNDSPAATREGYAQKLGRLIPDESISSDGLFQTHSALFAPWSQFKYAGTARNNPAPPAFLALMIQLAMVKNQAAQYEWIQPSSRRQNLTIGAPDYRIPKKLLDQWQGTEGVALNVITALPDIGTTLWGNYTLYDLPPANYNALANLSSRYLMNAVEDVAFRAGMSITFQYNNQEAYTKFFTSVSPLCDVMQSVGAITSYDIEMSKDLNNLDSVNINSVIGEIRLYVEGVINQISINLVALPAGTEGLE